MSSVIKIDPEIMSGAPCFDGTRVPIQNLIDYLEGGDGFPSVSRQQVIAYVEEAQRDIEAGRLITNEQMKARIGELLQPARRSRAEE